MINHNNIFIGISGFSYRTWYMEEGFYSSDTKHALTAYAKSFNAVEINSTFYKVPTEKTLIKWSLSVPEDFKFVLKVNRYFTHQKKLSIDADFEEQWRLFWEKCQLLGEKLGALLFQLPPSLCKPENLSTVLIRLEKLSKLLPSSPHIIFEMRNTCWESEEVKQLFIKYDWCLCVDYVNNHAGWAGNLHTGFFPQNMQDWQTASWGSYFRMHGYDAQYKGSYPMDILTLLSKTFKDNAARGLITYCAFNNTYENKIPSAIKNAISLRKLLES